MSDLPRQLRQLAESKPKGTLEREVLLQAAQRLDNMQNHIAQLKASGLGDWGSSAPVYGINGEEYSYERVVQLVDAYRELLRKVRFVRALLSMRDNSDPLRQAIDEVLSQEEGTKE